MFRKFRKIHFVGIGGIGMSGIAEILLNHGFTVSGSDLHLSSVTDRLAARGAKIHSGHCAENLADAEALVYSSAVKEDNPEIRAARGNKVPVIRRAEMLAELMRMKFGIAIAGTHGKTTTTSMVGTILVEAGLDPTVIVGGISPVFGSNARIGSSEFLVVEADEFDRSFLKLTPTIGVVTSIELEHLDCYRDLEDLLEAFGIFAGKVPFYGTVVVCRDEPSVLELCHRIDRPIKTYGLNPGAELRATDIEILNNRVSFKALDNDSLLGKVELYVPGEHNVKNALAAIAVGLELEIPFATISAGLLKFIGVKRRFEVKCEIGGVTVIDDYAHHPTEVRAAIAAAKSGYCRRLVAVFQPHLYSRTRDFHRDFGAAFQGAETVIVAPIYPAREAPLEGVSGEMIVKAAKELGHPDAHYAAERETLVEVMFEKIRPGDVVMTMGAGDIWMEGERLCEKLKSRYEG